jgi:hypothetical protein
LIQADTVWLKALCYQAHLYERLSHMAAGLHVNKDALSLFEGLRGYLPRVKGKIPNISLGKVNFFNTQK